MVVAGLGIAYYIVQLIVCSANMYILEDLHLVKNGHGLVELRLLLPLFA